MKNVIIIGTNGINKSFQVSSLIWGEIRTELENLGYDFPDNVKATLVRVGGIAAASNLGLSDNSVLPENGNNYLIALTQEKMKGAAEAEFDRDEIDDMLHREVISTLKGLRLEAKANGDDDLFNMIPANYSSLNATDAKNLLREVWDYVWGYINQEEEVETSSADLSKLQRQINNLNERVLRIESELLIPSEEFLNTL